MRILGLGGAVPSVVQTNEDRLQMLMDANKDKEEGFRKKSLRMARAMLALSGARERRVCAPGESAYTLGLLSAERAFEMAGIDRQSIELIICASVARPYFEPSAGFIFGEALGIDHAHAFDMSDACMSWLRAMYVAHGLLHSGQYKRIMIISAEFNAGFHKLDLSTIEDLEFTLPQLTIGEAATATILDAEGDPWPFWFFSSGGGNDLCKFPLPGAERWRAPGKPLLDPYRFYCHFGPMNEYTVAHFKGKFVPFFKRIRYEEGRPIDHAFTHASELTTWKRWAEEFDVVEQFYSIYPRYGNCVGASVPITMYDKMMEGKLKQGDGCFVYVASSGMSVGATHFKF